MVKFHIFCVLTLCACLVQICAGNMDIEVVEFRLRRIYGIGEQFVSDFVKFWEKYQNNPYVIKFISETMDIVDREIPKEKNSKVDVNQVKEYRSKYTENDVILFEQLKLLQSILPKQLPPEVCNGLVNLMFICLVDYSTTEEIQSALNYFYGVNVEATKTSFLDAHNIPNPTRESDCQQSNQWYSSTIVDELNRFVGMKPKVMQDFLAIHETFICNGFVHQSLEEFVHIIRRLSGSRAKINACMIKEGPGKWDGIPITKIHLEHQLEALESVLSARLPDETIRGIINFKRATIPDKPIDDIEKALEYLYDDVPKADCPTTTEGSTDA